MAHVRSLISATIGATLVVGVTFLTSTLQSPAAFAKTFPRCQETQLSVRWATGRVTLGHVADLIEIENISASACVVSGYPTVKMTGSAKSATVLVAKDTQNGYMGGLGGTGAKLALPVVKLRAHGGAASSMVEGDQNPSGPAACSVFTKTSMAIPHLKPPYRLTIHFPGCIRPEVHPFVAGLTGSSGK